jgi:pimeloyl-ACP methyl ester carboxylesterase
MPIVENEGAEIYWTAEGSGPPVLLIMGLSFTHEMWFRVLPGLRGQYRTILFDNRGMGRSSVPRGPYSIAQMARDARAVLHAAGHTSAAVVGASMGGMIAQELALRYPEAVERLILACTSHSGVLGRLPDFSCIPWPGRWTKLDRRERERRVLRILYADSTPRHLIDEDLNLRRECEWSAAGFRNQFLAIVKWSAYRRLPRLRVPALVVHGAEDRLIPVENGRVVARRIPGAEWVEIAQAGHILITDQVEACGRAMLNFLRRTDPDPTA